MLVGSNELRQRYLMVSLAQQVHASIPIVIVEVNRQESIPVDKKVPCCFHRQFLMRQDAPERIEQLAAPLLEARHIGIQDQMAQMPQYVCVCILLLIA